MVHRELSGAVLAVILDRRMALLGALMIAGAVLAHGMKPANRFDSGAPAVDLAAAIPPQFGKWRIDTNNVSIALPPELEEKQKQIYDQMLVRTYVNETGRRIMLTIAFGNNQSRMLQVHRPEVCYEALGFQVMNVRKVNLYAAGMAGQIPAMQLVAIQNVRNEPVTYWIRIGDRIVRGNIELGLARLGFGLRGYVADGLLFRASTITRESDEGFKLEEEFVRDLLATLGEQQRVVLLGRLGRQS